MWNPRGMRIIKTGCGKFELCLTGSKSCPLSSFVTVAMVRSHISEFLMWELPTFYTN
jgi:hypothetical protein